MKILIIEPDNSQRRGLFAAMRTDWEVNQAQSVTGALSLLDKGTFDIIITEIQFKTENGLRILDALHDQSTCIIISSASRSTSIDTFIAQNRCAHFLEKPINIEQLYAIIQQKQGDSK
jgi:DNA-binding NtrC family response regulator